MKQLMLICLILLCGCETVCLKKAELSKRGCHYVSETDNIEEARKLLYQGECIEMRGIR